MVFELKIAIIEAHDLAIFHSMVSLESFLSLTKESREQIL